MKKLTTEEFIEKAKSVHGDRYDYSKVEYTGVRTKVNIICKKHGEFTIQPSAHINNKQGCNKCGIENKKVGLEGFIKKSKTIHGDKYDYSKVIYKNNKIKVCIICPIHGEFYQRAERHMNAGNGCPYCRKNKKSNTEEFIEKSKEIHGDRYDYSKVEYIGATTKVCIVCPIHGEFYQKPNHHLLKCNCPKCADKIKGAYNKSNKEEFIEKAKKIHGDRYDYLEVNYKHNKEKVLIKCKEHGFFSQIPNGHLSGLGCPKCTPCMVQISKAEQEIFDFLSSHVKCIQSDRAVLNGMELDIYVPYLKLAVEYNGLYWHSDVNKEDNYHLEKLELSNSKGIKLIQIFEDEWEFNKEVVQSRLLNLINKTPNKIYARKTTIKEVPTLVAMEFLDKNHIQGKLGAKVKLGLYQDEELVSLMTFGGLRKNLGSSSKEGSYELLRFCNKLDTTVVGGASKLYKYFEKNYQPKEVISYADRRWSEGELYYNLGFELDGQSKPNYFYVKGIIRENRFKYRKSELIKQGHNPTQTEREIMNNLNYHRIYDCGVLRFKKKYNI